MKSAARYIDIDLLAPMPWNPRKNDAAVPKVVESIRQFGFGAPIVATQGKLCDGARHYVIAGHTRLKAARELGLKEVPVRFLDLGLEQAKRLNQADNRLGEIATWDYEAVSKQFQEWAIAGASRESIMGLGWDEDEVSMFLAADWTPPKIDPGAPPGRQEEDELRLWMSEVERRLEAATGGTWELVGADQIRQRESARLLASVNDERDAELLVHAREDLEKALSWLRKI